MGIELVDKIKNHLQGGERFRLDFFEYTRKEVLKMKESTSGVYINMLSALERFLI